MRHTDETLINRFWDPYAASKLRTLPSSLHHKINQKKSGPMENNLVQNVNMSVTPDYARITNVWEALSHLLVPSQFHMSSEIIGVRLVKLRPNYLEACTLNVAKRENLSIQFYREGTKKKAPPNSIPTNETKFPGVEVKASKVERKCRFHMCGNTAAKPNLVWTAIPKEPTAPKFNGKTREKRRFARLLSYESRKFSQKRDP